MRLYQGVVAAAVVSLAAVCAAQNYHVADHWKVGGQGGWDYLLSDDAAHRLYVTHNSRVEVVDTTTGKAIGAITGLKSTHGVALNPDGKTGYISDGAGKCNRRIQSRRFLRQSNGRQPARIPTASRLSRRRRPCGHSTDAAAISRYWIPLPTRSSPRCRLPGKPEFPQADGQGSVFDEHRGQE